MTTYHRLEALDRQPVGPQVIDAAISLIASMIIWASY